MGLDCSHDAWHGSYGNFAAWRYEVARAAGLPSLHNMYYHWNRTGEFPLPIEHPLYELLTHSDCEGYIEPEKCKAIADELTRILPNITDANEDYFIIKTKYFIAGCYAAYAANELLDFH